MFRRSLRTHLSSPSITAGLKSLLALTAFSAVLPLAHAAYRPGTPPAGSLATGEHQVVIDGVRFWYRVGGTANKGIPPLVFLHGGPGYNSHSFSVLAGPALERAHRVVYYDQRGSGHSERPWSGGYTLPQLVEDLEGLRQTLGVPQMALMGHSFGGALALEYAAKYPQHVARMVLVSAASDIPAACRARVDYLAAHYAAALTAARADTAGNGGKLRDDCDLAFNSLGDNDRGRANDEVMFPDMALVKRQNALDEASGLRNTGEMSGAFFGGGFTSYRFASPQKLSMPVLVLAGTDDYAIGMPSQRALATALPHAKLVEFEHAGHFLYLDDPAKFTRVVIDFLNAPAR